MKRIYTQSESVSLYSGIESTFDFNGNSSRIIITSQKLMDNPDFDEPLNINNKH